MHVYKVRTVGGDTVYVNLDKILFFRHIDEEACDIVFIDHLVLTVTVSASRLKTMIDNIRW